MIKNVFIKSILRQPVRSLLLFLLIGIASFAFIMRTVEYIVIHRHIHEIGRNYRAVGFLRAEDELADITDAADFLANSPFMGYEDRRRRFEGVLQNEYSPDVAGMHRHLPREERRLYTAAFFYAQVEEIFRDTEDEGIIWVNTRVMEVVAGSPEIVTPDSQFFWGWSETWLRFEFEPGGDTSPVDDLQVGEVHLFKAHHYRDPGQWWVTPVMQPLPDDDMLEQEIAAARHGSGAVTLQTTSDMNLLSDLQGRGSSMRLQNGRLINRADYVNQNHVAVINQAFAHMRGIGVGDTLTLRVYNNQFIHGTVPSTWMTDEGLVDARTELVIVSLPDDSGYTEVELQIVGIYSTFYRADETYGYGMIFVPDSIIPEIPLDTRNFPDNFLPYRQYGFQLNSTHEEQAFFLAYRDILLEYGVSLQMFRSGAEVFWTAADAILLSTAFNAIMFGLVVVLVLVLVTFLYVRQRHREFAINRALGMSVKKILLQTCISIFLIALPATAIGGTLAWHYAMEEAVNTLEPFTLLEGREDPFAPFRYDFVASAIEDAAQVEFSLIMLAALVAAFFGFILAMMLICLFVYLRRPVLEQLQGKSGGNIGRKSPPAKYAPPPEYVGPSKTGGLTKFDASPMPGVRLKHTLGWVSKHITRSRAKTFLTASLALIFLVALGWLQESTQRTADNIDYLFDNTVIHVELETHGIPFSGYERMHMLADSGYFDIIAPEAFHSLAFLLPEYAGGSTHDNWREQIGFDPNVGMQGNIDAGIFDNIVGVSCIDEFTSRHSAVLLGDDALGFSVDFVDGFDTASFAYTDSYLTQVVPVIISTTTAEARGLALGENIYLGYTAMPTTASPWHLIPARVVGIHNQHFHMPIAAVGLGNQAVAQAIALEMATIVPVTVVEAMLGSFTIYHALRLTIDTAFNRELDNAVDTLEYFMVQHRGFRPRTAQLEVLVYDEELRNMVGAMSQIHLLLELLYPVALALAIVIGAAVSLLLMLQMEKNAAIMRVLGKSGFKTCLTLCAEQLFVSLGGLLVGLVALIIMSWGFGLTALLTVVGIYLASVMAGAIVGAIMITAKTPLELLQVRE